MTYNAPPLSTHEIQNYAYTHDISVYACAQDILACIDDMEVSAQQPSLGAQDIFSLIDELETPAQPPSIWRELGALAIKIGAICVAFGLIFTFFYGFHRSTDPDMIPMLQSGDLVLFYRLSKDYAVGDLVLFDFQGERQVRRVVARAGDTVDFREGELIVNGAMQQEPDIIEQSWSYADGASFPLTVGEGQVFVLGDARENATDSRVYGPVNISDTLGSVITVFRRRNM